MNQPPNVSLISPNSISGLDHLGKFLERIQLSSGAIPSNKNNTHDPWDHLEAVMGLTTLGYKTEAAKGFNWMISNQNVDGSWYNLYDDQKPIELNKQTNHSSYLAVAAWHFFLLNKDIDFLQNHWEPIKRGIIFSLSLQNDNGAIAWNVDDKGEVDDDYLLTGCSSITKSLECGIAICQVLGHKNQEKEWRIAHAKLIKAIESPKGIFDLKKDRSKFSMDSYYPILGGINAKKMASSLMRNIKTTFWIKGLGIKCVSDEPWVTVAETSECSIAFKKMGEDKIALELLHNAIAIVDSRSIPFMGWQYIENIYWPEETPSWTSGACILAADANYKLTSASDLFLIQQFKS
tara:strand:+ start:3385 stop:4428 length:1044 start_codon:yes stop_codon:yes gene_type:complete